MSARDELLAFDGSDEWPAQVDAILARHRAEVQAEFEGYPGELSALRGLLGEVRPWATAPAVPVPDNTTGDEAETAVEYGIAIDNEYGKRVLDPSTDRAESLARLARGQVMWPNSRLVQRTVRYGAWAEVTS